MKNDDNGASRNGDSMTGAAFSAFIQKVSAGLAVPAILGIFVVAASIWLSVHDLESAVSQHNEMAVEKFRLADERHTEFLDFKDYGGRFTDKNGEELKVEIIDVINLRLKVLEAILRKELHVIKADIPPEKVRSAIQSLQNSMAIVEYKLGQDEKNNSD